MPLRKFEDLDSAREALWTHSDDPNLPVRIRRLWERTRRLTAPGGSVARGVRRFRTIVEANQDRLDATRRRLRAQRGKRGRSE